MPNFTVIPEKKFVLLTPTVGMLEKCWSFKNVRNKNGCVVSSTVLEKSIYRLVLMILSLITLFEQAFHEKFLDFYEYE